MKLVKCTAFCMVWLLSRSISHGIHTSANCCLGAASDAAVCWQDFTPRVLQQWCIVRCTDYGCF
jgi:hypothetical protein